MTIVEPPGKPPTPRRAKLDWMKELRGADLSHAEFRVLVVILTYTNASRDNAFPGLKQIVAGSCVTEKTARTAIKSLTAKGWLVLLDEGGNQHWKGKANVYAVRTGKAGNQNQKGGTKDRSREVLSSTPSRPASGHSIIPHLDDAGPTSSGRDVQDEMDEYEWLESELDGIYDIEESTVNGMLSNGCHPNAVLNKILKDRI